MRPADFESLDHLRLRSSRAGTAPREMKTIRCCLSRQTMKKFIKRRLNSFKTKTRTLSENVSLNRTKIILNRKNAIIHNKSRKLFLTERKDKQMIIEASRFRVARSLTVSPLTRRYSTSCNVTS